MGKKEEKILSDLLGQQRQWQQQFQSGYMTRLGDYQKSITGYQQQQQQQAGDAKQQADTGRDLFLGKLNLAQEKSPLETEAITRQTEWDKFASNPVKDYRNAPGLAYNMNLDMAKLARLRERAGTGAARMGAVQNPALLSMQHDVNDRELADSSASNYNNAVMAKDAQMKAGAVPLMSMDQSRRMGVLSAAGNYASGQQNAYEQAQDRVGQGQQLGLAGQSLGLQAQQVGYQPVQNSSNMMMSYLLRPKQPGFLKSLFLGALGRGEQAASALGG